MGFEAFVLGVLSSFVAGAALGVIGIHTHNRSAPKRYFNRIKAQILQGIEDGPSHSIRNAKIIVASRNRLRNSLSALGDSLNSEIDRLESMIFNIDRPPRMLPNPVGVYRNNANPEQVYEQIIVLKGYWNANEETVENAIKKVLVDLNII